MLIFGNSEVVLRFIPALLGVLTIPLIYLVGKEFMDRNVGIIAAAAFAFSPFLIFYSQEARAYSMMLFFVTFCHGFLFQGLKNNAMNWALFGISFCTCVLVPFLRAGYHRSTRPVCTL